jgi:hypothetical protein
MTTDDEQLLFALYEFENAHPRVLSYLERTYEDPAVQHCIDQAKHHLKLVHELLEGAVLNPQTHYDDARTFYQTLWKVLPLMTLMQVYELPLPDQVEEGSSPDTPSSVLSSQDIFELVTPSHQSEP